MSEYKPGDRVIRTVPGKLWPVGTVATLKSRNPCDPEMWEVDPDDAEQGLWRENRFEPLDSPVEPLQELQPGDRVKHETLGEGVVEHVITENGLACVHLGDDVRELIALNLLTKVEPEEEPKPPLTVADIRQWAVNYPCGENDAYTMGVELLHLIDSSNSAIEEETVTVGFVDVQPLKEPEAEESKRTDCFLDGHEVCSNCGNDHDCDMEDAELAAEIHYCINNPSSQQPEKTLLEKLQERAHRDTNGSTLYAESACDVERDHYNSKKDDMTDVLVRWGLGKSDGVRLALVQRFELILFGDTQ